MRFAFSIKSNSHSGLPSLLQDVLDGILAVTFPTDCALCGGELASDGCSRVCRACWTGLQPWGGPLCARCGLPFASPRALDSSLAMCGACRNHEPAFDGARSFGLYAGKLRLAILRLKFAGDDRLGARLGELLASTWDHLPARVESDLPLVVPIPLHPSRRRERGFNQSAMLAEGLAQTLRKRSHAPAPQIASACLGRKRATIPQTGLSVSARRENLRGAFEVTKPEAVRGRCIVLVDDVMTTGATLSAAARALKRAGVGRVLALTLARATPQFSDVTRADRDNTVDGLDRDST